MIELVGESARGCDFALVRLTISGDRIVDADALANALGPVLRAPPSRTRVAVAMSGGVDSAVALLRYAPHAIGVTLRLWLDPAGPDADRACCSPEAVTAPRR